MVERKNHWLRERCTKFYEEYKWDKVYFTTFYSRVRLNPDWDMEEMIKPKQKHYSKRASWVFTWAYAEELGWWYRQPEVKANKHVFYGRVRAWYPKEQAILTWDKRLAVSKAKPVKITPPYKPKLKAMAEEQAKEEQYTWIDITYPKDVARVFRIEYNRIIEDLEWSLTRIEEKTQVKETNEKLEMVRAELKLFNSYNK